MPEARAAEYEAPFEHALEFVKPKRSLSKSTRGEWWLHERPRPDMREALKDLSRFLVTPALSKHRLFVWMSADVLPDHQLFAFANEDDWFFGVLQSRFHTLWSLKKGTSLEDRPRYTATTTFETFPFPRVSEISKERIASAAVKLDRARRAWLAPENADDKTLKKRTLTNLYNDMPTWLRNAHRELDEAVAAAYEWNPDFADGDVLARLLALNLEREGA